MLGGTFADLPLRPARSSCRAARCASIRSPACSASLPARNDGPLADPEVRRLLTQAIDRDALIAALDVPGLVGRGDVCSKPGSKGLPDPGHADVDGDCRSATGGPA